MADSGFLRRRGTNSKGWGATYYLAKMKEIGLRERTSLAPPALGSANEMSGGATCILTIFKYQNDNCIIFVFVLGTYLLFCIFCAQIQHDENPSTATDK